ncbi:MAG: pyridoxal-phosphate dependent enzyme, partial [Anaerolineae bacterium]
VIKGFQELYRLGMIDKLPKLGIVQSAGCAPMVQAFERGDRTAAPVIPETLITVLATGDPGYSYVLLREYILKHGGAMVSVDDGQAFRAMRRVARTEGFSVEPASAVAFAGIEKMLALGHIAKEEVVLINCSGHTFPAEKHILEDQYVLDLELGAAAPTHQVEGLGAALERLDEQIKTIVVIDDNPHDSRLIRRLLQSQKNYRVFEANNPLDGLDLVIQRKPDLVISDLMMPQMDGFSLLEQLKTNSETAHIPVIVLSAKALTAADRGKLEGRTEAIWTKGNYKTRELVEYVASTLGDRPVAAVTAASSPASRSLATSTVNAPLRRVLIVDDNPHDSRLVRRILENTQRFEVVEAHSGTAALKSLQEQRPDLVILDMFLPDMGGLDVLEKIRSQDALRSTRVAILSAKDLTEAERRRLQDAVFWQKATLDRRRLVEAIDEQLR